MSDVSAGARLYGTIVRTGALLVCLVCGVAGRVAEASAPLGYVVERWSVEEGLPNNALMSVIQTRDGYLWIATWAGLARFDGVRFTTVADNLPNDHARAILEDADGSVWVGLSGTGVARWSPRGVDIVTPAQGLPASTSARWHWTKGASGWPPRTD